MCGIIGCVGNLDSSVNQLLYDGLLVLQHRGQDAAGIVTCKNDQLFLRKANGLVRDVFFERHMSKLPGSMGIGHVRYPTAGTCSSAEAQPLYVNTPYGISLAHNGNLTNADDQAKQLYVDDLRHVNTASDSEILLNVFAHELQMRGKLRIQDDLYLNVDDVFEAVVMVHKRIRGSYSAIAMINGYGMVAFRDPYGIRPLIFGKRVAEHGTEWMFASESVALTSLGFEIVRDVKPGEAVFISPDGTMFERQCSPNPNPHPCIFEYVYFARPDSIIDGISVHQARLNLGRLLGERILKERPEHGIDVVMPIPDSGRIAAMELAQTIGVPFREGFVKNRYVGRTFIMPGQAVRQDSVRKKLNPIPDEFAGKTVLLVDDSIVRGNTSAKIIQLARDVGAKKVFFASSSPPVIHPNVYGIDMPARDEYVAHHRTIDEIAEQITADWLIYQEVDSLYEACRGGTLDRQQFDASCFDGVYCTGDITEAYLDAVESARNDSAKLGQTKNDGIIDIHNQD